MLELDEFFGQGKLLEAQILWLKRLLRQKKQPWTVVLMHKDILAYDEYQPGSGSSGSFSDTGRAFLPTLQKLGVDLILTGHMHTYRRRGPLEGWSTGKKGPICLMSGPAGNQCYTVPSDPLDLAHRAELSHSHRPPQGADRHLSHCQRPGNRQHHLEKSRTDLNSYLPSFSHK